MSEPEDYDRAPVTNRQLRDALNDRPTRWEMRAMLAIAVVANQLIPALDISVNDTKAAVGAVVALAALGLLKLRSLM